MPRTAGGTLLLLAARRRAAAATRTSVRAHVAVSAGPWRQQLPATAGPAWHARRMSSAAPEQAEQPGQTQEEAPEPVLVYEGPMARAVRLMKGVSVTSCALTSVGMPTLCMISEQSASMVGKWAMCGTIMLFGLGTTSLFHVLFKPYVMRMWVNGGESTQTARDPALTVETVTLFAQLTKHDFRLSDVSPPASSMHPMLSFQAKGKSFFVHPEEFEDRAFAEKLLGKKIDAPRKGDDDDDEHE